MMKRIRRTGPRGRRCWRPWQDAECSTHWETARQCLLFVPGRTRRPEETGGEICFGLDRGVRKASGLRKWGCGTGRCGGREASPPVAGIWNWKRGKQCQEPREQPRPWAAQTGSQAPPAAQLPTPSARSPLGSGIWVSGGDRAPGWAGGEPKPGGRGAVPPPAASWGPAWGVCAQCPGLRAQGPSGETRTAA